MATSSCQELRQDFAQSGIVSRLVTVLGESDMGSLVFEESLLALQNLAAAGHEVTPFLSCYFDRYIVA